MVTLGIVGGGQLGRMLTLAALPLGFKVVVVDPSSNCPAAQVGAEQITADLYDSTALNKLAETADFITVEIEHLDTSVLEGLESAGKIINPSPSTVKLIQDKYEQKKFLEKAGVPIAPFVGISSKKTALDTLKKFGGKMYLKTRHGAYDGRGNVLVKNEKELEKALTNFNGKKLYAEKLVPFKKELAIMVAKSMDGDIKTYPVVETIHERSICVEVLAPAEIKESEAAAAKELAVKVEKHLKGAGTYGIEMFLSSDGKVLVNEIAPRVHNSGHYTIEACHTSQFEQHVRAVTGLPLGETDMVVPAAVMINILGERNGLTKITGHDDLLAHPQTSLHLYGKSPTKIDRKMGHITVTGKTVSELSKSARKARKRIKI